MQKDQIAMKCVRCGKQHRVLEMVMDASGKGMACRACAGLPPPGSRVAKPEVKPTLKAPVPREGRLHYHCLDCNFKFTSPRATSDAYCPYCGSKSVSERAKNSADALLGEAGDRRYEY